MHIQKLKSLKFPALNSLHWLKWLNLENIIWALFLTIIFTLTFVYLFSPIAYYVFSIPGLSFIKNIEFEKIFTYITTGIGGIFIAILCFYLIKFFEFILNKIIKFPIRLSSLRLILLIFSFVVFYGLGWLCGGIFAWVYDDRDGQHGNDSEDKILMKQIDIEEAKTSNDWGITWSLTSSVIILLVFKKVDKANNKL